MARDLVQWLQQEAPERQIYSSPPLRLALCQVRFATRYGLDDAAVRPFQLAIEDNYPLPERDEPFASLQISGAAVQHEVRQPVPSTHWRFRDLSGNWTVTLNEDFASLDTRKYEHFDDFLGRLRVILEALVETITPPVVLRIGLRYINEIVVHHGSVQEVVRPELLGPLAIDVIQDSAIQSVQIVQLKAGSSNVTIQHGLVPRGSTVPPIAGESQNESPFYLLDYDMYEEFNSSSVLSLSAEAVCKKVDAYHSTVSALFRWSTTDVFRDSLRG